MVDRRGFLWALLAAPFVGQTAAVSPVGSVLSDHGWLSERLWFPSKDGIYTTISYNDRLWFTPSDGPHVYYSDIPDPE